MSKVTAGVIALALIGIFCYFVVTKSNPFANPFEIQAVFKNADDIQPKGPVRIAGVEVGKVTKVQPLEGTETGARVTIELKESALPLHDDATLKVRPRIFLEGNKFVEMRPGSPTAPVLKDGGVIPIQQTSASVQFGDILTALQSDTRRDLQVFLKEYSKGIEGKGAKGFNDSIKYWEPAYKNTSLVNDATLGQEPTRDLRRVLRGQQKTFSALVENEDALKGLVTNLNVTAGALAREDVALERTIPALRDTLRAARPALLSLNGALPSLRAFAVDALPGVRSTPQTLDASTPFIRQARLLFRRSELRGAAKVLRQYTPTLVALNRLTIPVLEQGRGLSACTTHTLVPFANAPIPIPELPQVNNQPFRLQAPRGLVGLSGESRLSDGNLAYFHGLAEAPPVLGNPNLHSSGNSIRPAPPPDGGRSPVTHRPDVPCELQEPPNLNAPGGPATAFAGKGGTKRVNAPAQQRALKKYGEALQKSEKIVAERAKRKADRKRAEKGNRADRARRDAEAGR